MTGGATTSASGRGKWSERKGREDCMSVGPIHLSDLIAQIVSGVVTAGIGFAAAYTIAQRQRRWDAEDAAASAQAGLIQSARIPLEIIRDEIVAGWGFYYTSNVEEEITRRLREAIYGLHDEVLIRELERAVLPLRELATGNDRQASGKKCLPLVEAMLKRLAEFNAGLTSRRR